MSTAESYTMTVQREVDGRLETYSRLVKAEDAYSTLLYELEQVAGLVMGLTLAVADWTPPRPEEPTITDAVLRRQVVVRLRSDNGARTALGTLLAVGPVRHGQGEQGGLYGATRLRWAKVRLAAGDRHLQVPIADVTVLDRDGGDGLE